MLEKLAEILSSTTGLTLTQLAQMTGAKPQTISARIRELRNEWGINVISTRPEGVNREWEYHIC